MEGPRVAEAAPAIRTALRALDFHRCETIVVVSPHGRASGVYKLPRGSLAAFGIDGADVDVPTDPLLARGIAEEWGMPLLDDPVDHGIAVPLLVGFMPDVPVVTVALAEDQGDPIAAGVACAEAIAAAAGGGSVGVVFSAHTSASLTPRAPIFLPESERNQAREDEVELLETLHDRSRDRLRALRQMKFAHSCSFATLAGYLTVLGDGRSRHEGYYDPLGVGWLIEVCYKTPRPAPEKVPRGASDIARLDV